MIPTEIANITSLNQIYLNNNQLEGTISEEFKQLPNLEIFYMATNKLSCPVFPYGTLTVHNDFELSQLECCMLSLSPFPPQTASEIHFFLVCSHSKPCLAQKRLMATPTGR